MLSDPRPAAADQDDQDDQAPVDDWTVVVATRGDAAAVARIEDNIVDRLDGVPVLVVRNGGGAAVSMAGRPGVEVVDAPGGGVSRARNAALTAATTRTVVFVDDDVIVSSAELRTLVSRQREAGAAIACARIRPADAAHHGLFDDDLGFDRGPVSRAWSLAADGAVPVSPFNVWQFGVGATFAVDRELLGAVRFDERLSNGRFCGGTEDVDFFYAAYVAGRTISYVADAVLEHLFPLTAAAASAKCRQYALTDGAFYAKWARRVSRHDLHGEITGWWGRITKRRADRTAGRPSVPLPDLLAEPVYKLVGGVTWALVLRRLS